MASAENRSEELSGREFDGEVHYRIIRHIAEGGMGAVYEAVSYGAGGFEKTVALKVLLKEFSNDPQFTEKFVREAKLVSDLVHVHIVQIYHFGKIRTGELADRHFFAMEYVHGPNLLEVLARHLKKGVQFPVDIAVYIASRIARALDYAHMKRDRNGKLLGIVHRDISPTNVLISFEGEVKLLDFGIAKVAQWDPSDEDVLVGKARYMAPEYISGRQPDPRVDVYALGVVLWELLAGRPCFDGDSFTQILDRVKAFSPPPIKEFRPDVPDEIAMIIDRTTRKDPSERFLSAGMMALALEESIYRHGFGPTFVTLARHISEFFPELGVYSGAEEEATTIVITGGRMQKV